MKKCGVFEILKHLFIILILCSSSAVAWRSFKVIFTNFQFQFDSEVLDMKSQIENTTGESTLSLAINFLEEVDDVTMGAAIALEANDGNFTTLLNRSLNLCKFLKQRGQEPILRMLYDDLLKYGNFMRDCPIKKGQYALREYHLDEEMLPSYIPETNFIVDLRFEKPNGNVFFSGRLEGKIDKSKGFNNLKMFSLG